MQPEVFLSWRNITNVFKQISWQSMLALGVFIVIVTAGIDLSVGSIMMLSLMVLAITSKAGAAWYVVILIPILMGALCGMVNGFGITVLRMPHPFIMTLGTLYIFRGTGNLISGGVPISGFTEEVRLLGNGRIDLTWLGLEKSQYLTSQRNFNCCCFLFNVGIFKSYQNWKMDLCNWRKSKCSKSSRNKC